MRRTSMAAATTPHASTMVLPEDKDKDGSIKEICSDKGKTDRFE
jgi:hypothetical protein